MHWLVFEQSEVQRFSNKPSARHFSLGNLFWEQIAEILDEWTINSMNLKKVSFSSGFSNSLIWTELYKSTDTLLFRQTSSCPAVLHAPRAWSIVCGGSIFSRFLTSKNVHFSPFMEISSNWALSCLFLYFSPTSWN